MSDQLIPFETIKRRSKNGTQPIVTFIENEVKIIEGNFLLMEQPEESISLSISISEERDFYLKTKTDI